MMLEFPWLFFLIMGFFIVVNLVSMASFRRWEAVKKQIESKRRSVNKYKEALEQSDVTNTERSGSHDRAKSESD